jgi:hypothetical protein
MQVRCKTPLAITPITAQQAFQLGSGKGQTMIQADWRVGRIGQQIGHENLPWRLWATVWEEGIPLAD